MSHAPAYIAYIHKCSTADAIDVSLTYSAQNDWIIGRALDVAVSRQTGKSSQSGCNCVQAPEVGEGEDGSVIPDVEGRR
ncbi:hypothetical protein J6590_032621 [Homalodisca vitripennis]|nr:hypothetical protein J6590_032621 [Homalodisca vitripennis]